MFICCFNLEAQTTPNAFEVALKVFVCILIHINEGLFLTCKVGQSVHPRLRDARQSRKPQLCGLQPLQQLLAQAGRQRGCERGQSPALPRIGRARHQLQGHGCRIIRTEVPQIPDPTSRQHQGSEVHSRNGQPQEQYSALQIFREMEIVVNLSRVKTTTISHASTLQSRPFPHECLLVFGCDDMTGNSSLTCMGISCHDCVIHVEDLLIHTEK